MAWLFAAGSAPPAQKSAPVRVLNHEGLQESCGGDLDFARELFADLAQRAASLRQVMARAQAAASAEELRKAAHELKGSSLTLGAEAVAELCRRLEELGAEQRLAEAPPLVAALDEELARLWDYLASEGIYPAST